MNTTEQTAVSSSEELKNGKEPAFAAMNEQELFYGLTKREYFASQAMKGILANTSYT